QRPPSVAGPDRVICSKESIQVGIPANPGFSYTWTPVTLLSNPGLANPYTKNNMLVPVQFVVKTTNVITGCFSFDTTLITPKLVDTSSSFLGRQLYCPGETFFNIITSNNPSTSGIQWYRNNSVITGATNLSYRPPSGATGDYWAQVRQNGCIDSTKQYTIAFSPLPKVNFDGGREVQCLNSPIPFINKTSIATNDAMTYIWKFSDGSSSTDQDASKTFTSTGIYTIKLIATSSNECVDSIQKDIRVLENCSPLLPSAFTPNGDGLNDIIKPSMAGAKILKRFAIYNRYGNVLFSTSKEGEGWDGTYKGIKQDPGVFVWMLEYIANDDRKTVQKGTITLIR
ncbi:MAG: T9SS type B sorting domain-containing protein, partial [Bacteroidota bacterium]